MSTDGKHPEGDVMAEQSRTAERQVLPDGRWYDLHVAVRFHEGTLVPDAVDVALALSLMGVVEMDGPVLVPRR